MGDVFGILIFGFTFFLILKNREVNATRFLFFSFLVVLVALQSAALLNSLSILVVGVDQDAVTYFREAAHLSEVGDFDKFSKSDFYIQFLTTVFIVVGPSKFLGNELSVLASLFSCFFLMKIAGKLQLDRASPLIILVYGLLPSGIIFNSATLREPFEVFFFILTVYWAIQFQQKPLVRYVVFSLLCGIIFSLFHYSLVLPFVLVLILFFAIPSSTHAEDRNRRKYIQVGILCLFVLVLGISNQVPYLNHKIRVVTQYVKKPFDVIEKFRAGSARTRGRATYSPEKENFSTLPGVAATLSRAVVDYFLYPYPWKIKHPLDLYGFLEVLWRVGLIALAIASIRSMQGQQRDLFDKLLFLYFMTSIMWAMGTTNYGTAIRHHQTGNWMLVLLAAPVLIKIFDSHLKRISVAE